MLSSKDTTSHKDMTKKTLKFSKIQSDSLGWQEEVNKKVEDNMQVIEKDI